MPAKGQYFIQSNWSGGLADSPVLGLKGSFANGQGLNIHSNPGILTVNQALKKDSGSTVVDLCNFVVYGSDGSTYWFGDGGNIYKRTSGGVWTLVYTDGDGAILGAAFWAGRMYWATATHLSYKPFPGASDWSDVSHDAQVLNSSTWHPIFPHDLYLAIGNGVNVATVTLSNVFTANGTNVVTLGALPSNWNVSSLTKIGTDLLVGTATVNGDNTALCQRWDFYSTAFVTSQQIQENAINTFLLVDATVYALAGGSGSIYYYDGTQLQRYKRLPGNYDNASMVTTPGSSTIFRGLPLFGVSNNSGDPCTAGEGVYSLGHYDAKYPIVTNMEYVISSGHTTKLTIGAMIGIGTTTLLVAWKDVTSGTVYGVDVIDWSNKFASAFMQTVAVTGDRFNFKTFKNHIIAYKSLPASTSLVLSYFPNYGSKTSITLTKDSKTANYYTAQTNIQLGVVQEQIDFTVSGNNAPQVEGHYFDWEDANYEG